MIGCANRNKGTLHERCAARNRDARLRALLWLNFFVGHVQTGLDCDWRDCTGTRMLLGQWNRRKRDASKNQGTLSGGSADEKQRRGEFPNDNEDNAIYLPDRAGCGLAVWANHWAGRGT